MVPCSKGIDRKVLAQQLPPEMPYKWYEWMIQRTSHQTKVLALTKEGNCQYDGTELNIVMG